MGKNQFKHQSLYVVIVLPLVSILLTCCVLELLFAIFYPVPYTFEVNGEYEQDPYTCWKVKPNYRGIYLNGIPVCFNSLGLNNREITLKKKRRYL